MEFSRWNFRGGVYMAATSERLHSVFKVAERNIPVLPLSESEPEADSLVPVLFAAVCIVFE